MAKWGSEAIAVIETRDGIGLEWMDQIGDGQWMLTCKQACLLQIVILVTEGGKATLERITPASLAMGDEVILRAAP